jgi:MHS family proline/betaine transporter-like MFS transporter
MSASGERIPRRVVSSAALGNFIEWYDLAIYAYAAAAIGKTFFAGASQSVQLIASFAVFAVTYLVRPLSGLVLGVLGDRIGRKRLLIFTIVIMGIATTAIGILPGYAEWGLGATLLLLLLRVCQGIGAGGEFMGAATFVIEHTPARRHGLAMGLIQFGTGMCYPAAFGVAFLLTSQGGAQWFTEGGWRMMFLISAPLTLVALYIRKSLDESPVFTELKKTNEIARHPVRELFRDHTRAVVAGVLFMSVFGTLGAQYLFYLPNLVRDRDELGSATSVIVVGGLLSFAVSIPLWGALVDRIPRRSARLVYTVGGTIVALPGYVMIHSSSAILVGMGFIAVGLLTGLCFPVIYLTLVELMPARIRFTGTALVDNLSKGLVLGTTAVVSLSLIELTGSVLAPAWYATAGGLVAIAACFWLERIQAAPPRDRADQEQSTPAPEVTDLAYP